jgi:hypothetical protein
MLDFIGTIGLTAATLVTFSAILSALRVQLRARVAVAVALGLWIGTAVALGASGELADAGVRTVPLVGVLFAAPLAAVALAAAFVPAVRAALLALPLPLLVGLNASRVLGFMFVLLGADGRLGGPFPYVAGWGDVIAGVLAVPTIWLVARSSAPARRIAHAWNAFGALDLLVAVVLGMTSANGGALQLIDAGAGSAAMQVLPWSLIPTVLVPSLLVIHAMIYAQLRRAGVAAVERRSDLEGRDVVAGQELSAAR